jgi:hypothetical protein
MRNWISRRQKLVSKKDLKSFGWLIGGALLAGSAALFYNEKNAFIHFLLGSMAFLLAASFAPWILKPAWHAWMTLAQILGTIATALMLSLVFLTGICLISVVMRLQLKKKKPRYGDQNSQTYWIKRTATKASGKSMEVQY